MSQPSASASGREPGRNDPCPCGSGRKYKQCCAEKDRALAARASLADAHYRRGLALERAGRIDPAIEAYRAATVAGGVPGAHSRLGHIFLGRRRLEDAAHAFRAAAAADPENPERRMDLVRALQAEKNDAAAEAEVRGLLDLHPRDADAGWVLGRLLAESGRFEEAALVLERSVNLKPDQGVVFYDLSRARKLTQADRPLIHRMLAAARTLAGGGYAVEQGVMLQLALAKAHDDLGDYETAMRHIASAHRLKRAMVRLDRAALARRVDGLIDRFTPDFVAAEAARGNHSERPIFVLGMPRSGTTLVEQILSSHGEVEGGGELQFWLMRGPVFETMTGDGAVHGYLAGAASAYLATLDAVSTEAARIIDKNPYNFFWAGLIHLAFPNATIVHCRRHPIDTCLSIGATYLPATAEFSTDPEDLVVYWREYRRLTEHWRAVLPSSRFVEVDYEALIADPETVSRALVAACGLAWDPACLHPENNERMVRTSSRWQVRQPIYASSTERWRRYAPWIGALSALVEPS